MRTVSGLWNTPKNHNRKMRILKKRDEMNVPYHRKDTYQESYVQDLRFLTKNREYELGF